MIIAFAGQKGGGGKTTSAISVASEWHARKRRVVLVDADPQGSALTWAGVGAEAGASMPTVIAMGAGLHRPDQLPALSQNYDVTIIDCPPRHGDIQRAALMVADLVVLPCGPSALDAWALAASIDLITEARVLRPELNVAILITKKNARTALGAGAREVLSSSGLPILETELGYRVTYQEAPAAGLGPSTYDPTGAASLEVRRLVDELELFMTKEVLRASA
ncbi:MAG TPA: ParA family partition ATPase [Polyangia bacterium]|nr:ParA family partition ATPase [Polyangia bacterium]